MKKNDDTEKKLAEKYDGRGEDELVIPDSDQVFQSEPNHAEVSQFKIPATASNNIAQEAGVQDSEGINKDD